MATGTKFQRNLPVVISGMMKAVKRLETPVPVEIYTGAFLKKNPTKVRRCWFLFPLK